MQDSNYPTHGMDRRDMFKGTAAVGLALTVGVEAAFTAQSADNPIRVDNSRPGVTPCRRMEPPGRRDPKNVCSE